MTPFSSATITPDFDGNLGSDVRKVATWTVSTFDVNFKTSLSIPLKKSFNYDPAAGNLLIEIIKDRSAHFGDGPIYVDGTVDAPGVALVTDQFGVQPGHGMTIGFIHFVDAK